MVAVQTPFLDKYKSRLQGLNDSEVMERLKQYGENKIAIHRQTVISILVRQFSNSLVYLLFIASILSFALHDFSGGLVIIAILVINTFISFFQEYRSEKIVEKLERLISSQVATFRDGKEILVDEKFIVPGDIIFFTEGNKIPADLVLLEGDNVLINESELTGESVPVSKIVANSLSEQNQGKYTLFAGSTVEKGEGKGLVIATGNKTKLGNIASLSENTRKVTQYEQSLKSFSSFLMKTTFLTLALIFISKIFITHDVSHITTFLLFIIALAIAVVPEALPVIATITLAKGAIELAKRHVVVKRLSSLEDLGKITVLCTDKTGTLTENKMDVKSIDSMDRDLFQTLAFATLESFQMRKGSINSYDNAFISYIPKNLKIKARDFVKVKEVPFDPVARRRRTIIQNRKTNKYYLVINGTAQTLIELSNTGTTKYSEYSKKIVEEEKQGLRHIGIAYREISYEPKLNLEKYENHLTFLGFATLADPLRPNTISTLEHAKKLGVSVKILTGDSKEVAEYVGNEVGLIESGVPVYIGEEIEKMKDEELRKIVQECNIFAKVTPEQKYRIITILKETEVVGYQGDGINDAPALKLADVGIAVNTATDVAKESSEILLLRKDLEVIINGIHYGRAIFVNINKYVKYTMVGNFGNFFAIAGLYLISTDLPLLPIQLLLTSLITDLPHVFVYSDNVNTEQVTKPQKYNIQSLMFISLILGTLTTLFEFFFFAIIRLGATTFTETSLFLFLTFVQLIVIFSIRNTHFFWQGRGPSFLLTSGTIIVFILSFVFVYFAPLAKLFSFTTLPLSEISLIVIIMFVYFISLDTIKVLYYKMTLPKVTNEIK